MLSVMVKKELRRVFSDKRLVFSVLIVPAIMIFVMYSVMGTMLKGLISDVETHISQVYVLNAPDQLIEYSQGKAPEMEIQYLNDTIGLDDIKESIRSGDVDLLVEFDEEFMDKVVNYITIDEIPQVSTYYNPSENYSSRARENYLVSILEGFEAQLLTERFANLDDLRAFDVDPESPKVIQDEKKATGKGLGMLMPMLITIFLFAGAMSIGIDTIAGEKERGTMATLLLSPVKRKTLALGKIISLGVISMLSALISFVAMIASMPFSSIIYTGDSEVDLGALGFGILEYGQLLLIMVTLVGVFVGIICFLSVRARTVKEASAYISPVYLVVMVAAFSNMFATGTPELTKFAIPVYNSVLAMKSLLEFELTMQQFMLTISSCLVVTLLLIVLITKTFDDEKVMLNA